MGSLGSWVALAFGGAVGTVLRHAVARAGARYFGATWFPVGTFAANVLGSCLLGLVFVLAEERSILGVDARLVLGTGVMGGFTTYSSFNLEALRLCVEEPGWRGVLYILATVGTCLVAGYAGLSLGKVIR